MKKSSTTFLQVVVVLIGVGVFALMLWEPHLEGRNAHATTFQIYFQDPFLAWAYLASIPFFVALYQAFKVLGYAGENRALSQPAVDAFRIIKTCAFVTASAIVATAAFLMLHARLTAPAARDDAAGAVALCIIATFASLVIGTAAAVFQRILQNAVDIKSENDLVV